jgi:hypothetical protein
VPTGWKVREDVAELLVEELGFTPDEDYPDMFWRKGSCVWRMIGSDGRGELEDGRARWSLPFGPDVPARIVAAVAREILADSRTALQDHAHQLAEQIRKDAQRRYDRDYSDNRIFRLNGAKIAADLIDPEVQK